MGAGNPLLRSYDPELFTPTTYFIDFQKNCEEDEVDYCTTLYVIEDLKESLSFKFDNLKKSRDKYEDSLSAGFRESGIIFLKSEDVLIITSTDSEINHFAIGCVPAFTYDDIYSETSDETDSKYQWYRQRDITHKYWEMVDKVSLKEYNKKLKKFKKEASLYLTYINELYDLTMRCGAWTTSDVIKSKKIIA